MLNRNNFQKRGISLGVIRAKSSILSIRGFLKKSELRSYLCLKQTDRSVKRYGMVGPLCDVTESRKVTNYGSENCPPPQNKRA